jgi:transcriptional regulator with XRE-family HTH domain
MATCGVIDYPQMSTQSDDVTRREKVGTLVREVRERKGWSVVRAVTEAKKSPDTEIGRSRWTQIEQGHSPLATAATLARVARTLDIEPEKLWSAAGYVSVGGNVVASSDTEYGRYVQERLDEEAEELRRLDADILDELKAIRTELQRLGDAQQQIAERLPAPPPPAESSPPRAGRATRQAKLASE